mmetsp:Transcript_25162/g.46114  ORF Transcript_25162/g.46114 Transcript_25162/m.46114 type:complete len:231 (-) Transcript_25162:10-702(-)
MLAAHRSLHDCQAARRIEAVCASPRGQRQAANGQSRIAGQHGMLRVGSPPAMQPKAATPPGTLAERSKPPSQVAQSPRAKKNVVSYSPPSFAPPTRASLGRAVPAASTPQPQRAAAKQKPQLLPKQDRPQVSTKFQKTEQGHKIVIANTATGPEEKVGEVHQDPPLSPPRVVLTSKLATRLLSELLEAYSRGDNTVDGAQEVIGSRWGFDGAAEMTSCIEQQANASYACK